MKLNVKSSEVPTTQIKNELIKLVSNRSYLLPLLDSAEFYFHDKLDGSVQNKSKLFSIPSTSIFRVIFFAYLNSTIGICTNQDEKIDIKKILKLFYPNHSNSQLKRFDLGIDLPFGMIRGTSTPFLTEESSLQLSKLIILKTEKSNMLDVSLGGIDQISLGFSVWISFSTLIDILTNAPFSNKIEYI